MHQCTDDVPHSVIHSCSQKILLKCKTDPYKFWNWKYAPSASVVLARWLKLLLFQLYNGIKIFKVIWKSFGHGRMSTGRSWVLNSDCKWSPIQVLTTLSVARVSEATIRRLYINSYLMRAQLLYRWKKKKFSTIGIRCNIKS